MHRNAILVIDDEEKWARLLTWSLRNAFPDMRVRMALDESEALKIAHEFGDTLFLVTLDLGGFRFLHGHQIGVQLRHSFPHAMILPVTANRRADVELEGLGCLPPIIKNVTPDVVVTAIRRARATQMAPLPQEAWVTRSLHQVDTFVTAERTNPEAVRALLVPDVKPESDMLAKLLAVQRHLQRACERSDSRDNRQALEIINHMIVDISFQNPN